MTKTLLCFGDSNTYGMKPMRDTRDPIERFDAKTRWPGVTAAQLGDSWEVIEEGLPGRTTHHADPVAGAYLNGLIGLRIALCSNGPIDAMVIMLGTNDARASFGGTAMSVVSGLAAVLEIVNSDEMQDRHGGFETLIICPPAIVEQGPFAPQLWGAAQVSRELPSLYASLAAAHSAAFLDAGELIAVSPVDGVHFDAAEHTTLGVAIAGAARDLVGG